MRWPTALAVALVASLSLVCSSARKPSETGVIQAPAGADRYAGAPPYLRPVVPEARFWTIATAGQEIPATGGAEGAVFRIVGVPDGMGVHRLEGGAEKGKLVLLVNHELHKTDGGRAGPLPAGARVSELILGYRRLGEESRVEVISGRYAIERLWIGEVPARLDPVPSGLASLCSACLAAESVGFDRPIFLTGEESVGSATMDGRGGQAFAVFGGDAYALARIGRASWENIVAVPFTGEKTVIFPLEDGPSDGDGLHSQLYMYVGDKNRSASDPLARNGLNNGKTYVFAATDTSLASEATFKVKGRTISGRWSEVAWDPNQTDFDFDAASRKAGASAFIRIEDGSADPVTPGSFYFVTTGTPETVNPLGRLYHLQFDPSNPTGPASLTLVLDGSEGIVSPDNIDINRHGELMLLEDPGYNLASDLGLTRDSSIWVYNLRSAKLERIAEIDREAARAHALAADPGNSSRVSSDTPGGWEASGIIDAEAWLGRGSWILDVQAHSLRIVPENETVQGSQILYLHWRPEG